MSDSDDTEVLILIPPDLFHIESSDSEISSKVRNEKPNLVLDLCHQVHSLQSRVKSIESHKICKSSKSLDCLVSHRKKPAGSDQYNKWNSNFWANLSVPLRMQLKDHPSQNTKASINAAMIESDSNVPKKHEFLSFSERASPVKNFSNGKNYNFKSFLKASSTPLKSDSRSNANINLSDFDNTLKNFSEFNMRNRNVQNIPRANPAQQSNENVNRASDDFTFTNINKYLMGDFHVNGFKGKTASGNLFEFPGNGLDIQATAKDLQNDKEKINCPKLQPLITLSDFWEDNSTKSPDKKFRMKLEEEEVRRKHCEEAIQDLQKKILELQEKLALAVKMDKNKNSAISDFQTSWKKMEEKLLSVESEKKNLEASFHNLSEKQKIQSYEFEEHLRKCKDEYSKALDLATGYKDKCDCMAKEKCDLIKMHDLEIQTFEEKLQKIERRLQKMKDESQKLFKQNQEIDEALDSTKQELRKERLRSAEVRSEMASIHKSLDSCKAELSVLRQEKDTFQSKLEEQIKKNELLISEKTSLLEAMAKEKMDEEMTKKKIKSLMHEREMERSELQKIYQRQKDEAISLKTQDFKSQLEAARLSYENDLESNRKGIAEFYAKKIKSCCDRYRLEISLLEQKHKEENRLYEVNLSEAKQKLALLSSRISNQQASKEETMEQLRLVMQNQWKQACKIISGDTVAKAKKSTNYADFNKLETLESGKLLSSKTQPWIS